MNTTTLSAFFSELEKIAVHIRSPEHGKKLRALFRELRGIGKIAPGDNTKRMASFTGHMDTAVAGLVSDPRTRAARQIGNLSSEAAHNIGDKTPAQLLEAAKKLEPVLNKKHVRTSLAQRSLNLPVNKKLFSGSTGGSLTENSAKTLNSLKNSRIAKAFEKGDKGKLRFKKGKHSGSYTPRYDVDRLGRQGSQVTTNTLLKSEPGSIKRDVDKAHSQLTNLEKSLTPPPHSNPTPRSTPTPHVAPPQHSDPTPDTPKNNHLPAKLVAGAGGVGLAGYAAHRFLKKKKEE